MRINEIFCSLQGEGYHSGTAAVFLRLSGCNLRCPFCDTNHAPFEELTEEEIAQRIEGFRPKIVVVTGGEPALQLTASLVERLHAAGKQVHVETNGTLPLPSEVDWITLSPKSAFVGEIARVALTYADELKLLFDGKHEPSLPVGIEAKHLFLQPIDTGDATVNHTLRHQAADYCIQHPEWRLSLQIHKILQIQ